jgi:hypothetical protein
LSEYCRKAYKKVRVTRTEERQQTVCQKVHNFNVAFQYRYLIINCFLSRKTAFMLTPSEPSVIDDMNIKIWIRLPRNKSPKPLRLGMPVKLNRLKIVKCFTIPYSLLTSVFWTPSTVTSCEKEPVGTVWRWLELCVTLALASSGKLES